MRGWNRQLRRTNTSWDALADVLLCPEMEQIDVRTVPFPGNEFVGESMYADSAS
jgi:hypothetical protein